MGIIRELQQKYYFGRRRLPPPPFPPTTKIEGNDPACTERRRGRTAAWSRHNRELATDSRRFIARSMFGLVALGAVPDGGVAVPPHLGAAGAHDPLVHGGLHAVVLLDVQLGERVVVEHRRLADVTERGSIHDVPGMAREKSHGKTIREKKYRQENSSWRNDNKKTPKGRYRLKALSRNMMLERCSSWRQRNGHKRRTTQYFSRTRLRM